MPSKTRIRQIIGLRSKKERDENRIYLIEGDKIVKEYLKAGTRLKLLAAKPEFISSLGGHEKEIIDEIESCSYEDLKKMSTLKTPHNAIAVVPFAETDYDTDVFLKGLSVALDFVQDPGNMGTIIRSAAWFGIKHIFCSDNCVDLYNPKVIQASMGSVLNVSVHYSDLRVILGQAREVRCPVYGTVLDGESVYDHPLDEKGIILLGNESKGVSGELQTYVTNRISIPKFNDSSFGIESLNVSMAASVVFSEFRRRPRQGYGTNRQK